MTATLAIIDYFGKTNVVEDPEIRTKREGGAEAIQAFKISAGITGGNTTSPLIITEKGNLAGFLLNSGARLQTRANELSGKESRVMVAKQVAMNYVKENEAKRCTLFKNKALYFLDTGQIEFKGVMIPTCEAVFRAEDRYKERLDEPLQRLLGSIKEGLWGERIYQDMMELIAKAARYMKKFTVIPRSPVYGMQNIDNDSLIEICKKGNKAYLADEDYSGAVGCLETIEAILLQVPGFDRLILDYLRGVTEKYKALLSFYTEAIDRELDARAPQVFQGNYLKAWYASKNTLNVYEKLKAVGRRSPEIPKKKALWYNLIKQHSGDMGFVLHSGKK
jgi:hypothetical protein